MKKNLINTVVGVLCLGAAGITSATTISLEIEAYIDGRDLLVVENNSLYWNHQDFAAVGRWFGYNQPTYVSLWVDNNQVMNRYEWIPAWPELPPAEIRYQAYSDKFQSPTSIIPFGGSFSALTVLTGRDSVSLMQAPGSSNNYQMIVEFNDNPSGGAEWYRANIQIAAVPEPGMFAMLLAGLGMVGLASRRRKTI